MGFFDWLFGKKEETKPVQATTQKTENVNLSEAMKETTKEEEIIKRYVKVIDLNSLDKIETIRKDLLKGNVVITDIEEISSGGKNSTLLQMVLRELKNKVEEVHGEIARLSEQRLIIIPSDMKFVRVEGKEKE